MSLDAPYFDCRNDYTHGVFVALHAHHRCRVKHTSHACYHRDMLTADNLWYGLLIGMAISMGIVVVSFVRRAADSMHLILVITANALVMLASAIYVHGRARDAAAAA